MRPALRHRGRWYLSHVTLLILGPHTPGRIGWVCLNMGGQPDAASHAARVLKSDPCVLLGWGGESTAVTGR